MFEPETIVADALAMHPHARWVFAAYHIGGCNGCSSAANETLEEVASGYGLPLDALLRDLNTLLTSDQVDELTSRRAGESPESRIFTPRLDHSITR
jgi:hybrid cluster-associated redox disulfide protein